ncbi:MAG: hypothetical protein L0027_14975 [Candidatus Rokubacteria bacterium]|nr:hypothetical protein [Candidatus Rokubacteria bacterium]
MQVIDCLKVRTVLDERALSRTSEPAFVQTTLALLDKWDLVCTVSLPPGTFVKAGTGGEDQSPFLTRSRSASASATTTVPPSRRRPRVPSVDSPAAS